MDASGLSFARAPPLLVVSARLVVSNSSPSPSSSPWTPLPLSCPLLRGAAAVPVTCSRGQRRVHVPELSRAFPSSSAPSPLLREASRRHYRPATPTLELQYSDKAATAACSSPPRRPPIYMPSRALPSSSTSAPRPTRPPRPTHPSPELLPASIRRHGRRLLRLKFQRTPSSLFPTTTISSAVLRRASPTPRPVAGDPVAASP
jgi:hypothetical protein